jgi:predicted PurR-regulated permease PerM
MNTLENDKLITKNIIEMAIKITVLSVLIVYAFQLVKPFITPVIWGIILAVAVEPLIAKIADKFGGKRTLAATLFVAIIIAALVIPTVLLIISSFDAVQLLNEQIDAKTLVIPPPPASISEWPVIGEPLYKTWHLASTNLEAALKQFAPQIKSISVAALGSVGGGFAGILLVILSTCISGVFLAKAETCSIFAKSLFRRVGGEPGADMADLSTATIRSVMLGVVGVAVIQAALSAIGMVFVGVPAAILWTLMVLVCAVSQLPTIIILGPVAAYVFSVNETAPAVIFLVWAILVSVSDSFLKPMLMGRGVDIPMLVILIGAIGGMMLSGIIGLFVGAVVLAIIYTLFMSWMEDSTKEANIET